MKEQFPLVLTPEEVDELAEGKTVEFETAEKRITIDVPDSWR